MKARIGSLRAIAIVLIALLIAILVLRDASGRAPADGALATIKPLFRNHPTNIKERLMLDAAKAARDGKGLDSAAHEIVGSLAKSRPLAPEPFLIEGAIAQLDRDLPRAEQLYIDARNRDPRDIAARLVLVDTYLQQGKIKAALEETIVMRRIRPEATRAILLALVDFAKQPDSDRILEPLIRNQKGLRNALLQELAADSENARLIARLAPLGRGDAERPWEKRLLNSLVRDGKIPEAKAFWTQLIGARHSAPLFDPEFKGDEALPPFNWDLPTNAAGVATMAEGGGLEIVYFGREGAVLARQMLTLGSGTYLLATNIAGSDDLDLVWMLRCTSGPDIVDFPVSQTGRFAVPANCPGQWLELGGLPPIEPRKSEATIRRVTLQRIEP